MPASHYFAPLQREKTKRQSSFTVSKPPTLEEWQHDDFKRRAEANKSMKNLYLKQHRSRKTAGNHNKSTVSQKLSDSVLKWMARKRDEQNQSRKERRKRVALEGEEAVRDSERLERKKGRDEFKDMREEKIRSLENALAKKSEMFTVPVPARPADDIHRLKIKAASQNDSTGELRGEIE